MWALLEAERANIMPGAGNIAKGILTSHLPELSLGTVDFWATRSVRPVGPDPQAWDETARFVLLIRTCLKNGWVNEASELLRLSYEHSRQQRPGPKPREAPPSFAFYGSDGPSTIPLAPFFVSSLANALRESNAPFIEPAQKLIEHIIRTYVIDRPPVLPPKPEGWAHKPISCNRLTCEVCPPLNIFLTDASRQVGIFCNTQTNRSHIEKKLEPRPDLFSLTTSPNGLRNGRKCPTLVVSKRVPGVEDSRLLDWYWKEAQTFKDKTGAFRGEHFRRILGDELYEEIVVLRRYPESYANAGGDQQVLTQIKTEAVPQAVTGVKREAEDHSMFPPAARRY